MTSLVWRLLFEEAMELTQAGEYGVRGAAYLARTARDGRVSLKTISKAGRLSQPFLAKVFQALARAGILISVRGPRGGFALARPPAQITLLEIIEAVDGPVALHRCLVEPSVCRRVRQCRLRRILRKTQGRLLNDLRQISLKSLASET